MQNNLWVELVDLSEEIAKEIYDWRQDPITLASSCHSMPQAWENFWEEFRYQYFQLRELSLAVVRSAEKRVAYVRFRPCSLYKESSFVRTREISILVCPSMRGRGYGYQTLLRAEKLALENGIHRLVAYIRPENEASKELFRKAGYGFIGQQEGIAAHAVVLLVPSND